MVTQQIINTMALQADRLGAIERHLRGRLAHHGASVDLKLEGGYAGIMVYTIRANKWEWIVHNDIAEYINAMVTALETVLIEKSGGAFADLPSTGESEEQNDKRT